MVFQNDILAGSSGASGASSADLIAQSIRFNSSDSTYMQRTHGAGGNVDKWSLSFWLKRSTLGTEQYVFGSGANTSNTSDISFNTSDQLVFWSYISAYQTRLITTQVLRDTSAWYHVLVVYDSGNATSGNRAIIYINGSRVTAFGTETYPSQNQDGIVGSNVNIGFGRYISNGSNYFDGYLSEMHYVNGSALAPTDFGETTSDGIWKPIEYTGSHGTGGFHIKGEDSSDLGNDSSGNGNDFTTSGLASHDQVFDTPLNNFATINPIYADSSGINSLTLSEGNLEVAGTSSAFDVKGMTFNLPKSGKWYFEYTIGGGYDGFGFCVVGEEGSITGSNGLGALSTSQGGGIQYRGWRNGGNYTVTFSTYASSVFTSGDIHQVAIDVDNGKWYYGIANTYYANDGGTDGNPSAGTNHLTTFDFAGNDVVLMTAVSTDSNAEHWNFGQNGTFNGTKTAQGNSDANGVGNFYYAPPTGFLALCTKNLGAD